jgi:hypothetical protein
VRVTEEALLVQAKSTLHKYIVWKMILQRTEDPKKKISIHIGVMARDRNKVENSNGGGEATVVFALGKT